jgi:F-type H+-transporting ATPase subunit epsilon
MQLDILTPERKVFSGNVYGILLPGTEGTFELLENHAAIIASLGKGKMKVFRDKNNSSSAETYDISGGFVEMLNNSASVLIEDATLVQG